MYSGERLYICKECGKGFFERGILKKYEWIYSGEKFYICKDCGKFYS